MALQDRDLWSADDAPDGTNIGPAREMARRIAERFVAERERWPLWLPVLIGSGIGAYFWLHSEPPRWLGAALLVLSVALLAAAWRGGRAVVAPAILLAVALGFAAAQLQAALVAAPVLARRLGPVTVEGRLEAVDPLPEGARLVIAPSRIDRLDAGAMPARVRICLRHDDEAAIPGAWLRLRAVLMPPPAPALPGAFDFERRAWFDRLGAVGYALGAPHWIAPPAGAGAATWRVALQSLRTGVTQRIPRRCPARAAPSPRRSSPATRMRSRRPTRTPSATPGWRISWSSRACIWAWSRASRSSRCAPSSP